MPNDTLLECRGISKHFGPTHALTDVSIRLHKGKIHGLTGENGSGKSTLTSIIAGIYQPSGGRMTLEGAEWKPQNALIARENGVRMIVQEAGTIPYISVAENIFLGQEDRFQRGPVINRAALNREARKALQNVGVEDIPETTSTHTIDIQMRKIVEMARATYGEPKLFIIDETTTALSQKGRQILYELMHRLSGQGACVVIISHDIEELLEHCDNITVLRDGRLVGTVERPDFDAGTIKQMMIGRDLGDNYYRSDMDGFSDEVVLRAQNVTTLHELMNFSPELHRGEILGIGGLSECGMHTLGKALYGYEPVIAGAVTLPGKGVAVKNPETAMRHGLAYVSKNRDQESLALNAPILENIASAGYERNRVWGPVISSGKEAAYVRKEINDLNIKCNSMDDEVRSLSGGNKQKVVFGKWVARDSDILILDCPTRGVDIGVKAAMYQLMYLMKKAGKSIVMISEELPELIGMSDRLLILKDGRQTAEFLRSEKPTESRLIEYMI